LSIGSWASFASVLSSMSSRSLLSHQSSKGVMTAPARCGHSGVATHE
jgi:hypothetical protein